MFRYTPAGFPDPASCGAFYDARYAIFSGEDMLALEYSGTEASPFEAKSFQKDRSN